MLISLWIRVELYLINVLCNYASIINILPYFANTVSAWQLCQCFDFDCIYTVCDNERVVFSFTNETTQMIYSSMTHYIYNSLLISLNKIKYMLNSTLNCTSSKKFP